MSSSTQSAEQRELSLVGKVEMRIALADSDAKLETTLKTYLAPLLLKLASEHPSVRNKVISVCQHVNTRVKPQSIQLPVAALVKQFKDQDSSLIRHFDLLYIQQGVGRLSAGEKAELLPIVVKGIAASGSHASQIFNLLLRLLDSFTLPTRATKEDDEMKSRFDVSDDDTMFIASWVGKLILFTPQKTASATCPGLTADDCLFLSLQNKDDTWNATMGGLNLLRTKILSAKLLASGLFNDKERFIPALYCSADAASTISNVGEDILKRTMPATDLEDESLIHNLYTLYFGAEGQPRVRPPLRMKILGLLNKSTHSTTFSHQIAKMVDDGITVAARDGDDTVMSGTAGSTTGAGREAAKLRTAIFSYVNFVARYGSKDALYAIAAPVVAKLRDFVETQGWPRPVANEDMVSRGYAYEVIGLLAKAGPRNLLVEDDQPTLDLIRWLFSSLAKDSSGGSIVVSIEEALSTCLSAMAKISLNEPEQSVLEDLLVDQMEQSANLESYQRLRSTRYTTIRFANRCLPYSSVKARWVDVLGIGAKNDRVEVSEEAERGLSPYWYKMLNGSIGSPEEMSIEFPDTKALVAQFFAGHTTDSTVEPAALAQHAALQHSTCISHMTAFVRRILYAQILRASQLSPETGSEWEKRIDAAIETDEKSRDAVKTYFKDLPDDKRREVQILLSAQLESLTLSAGASDDSLNELLALTPDVLVQPLLRSLDKLMPILISNNIGRRRAAAHAFGILASHPASERTRVAARLEQLSEKAQNLDTAIGAAVNQAHGAIVALGFYLSRRVARGLQLDARDNYTSFINSVIDVSASTGDKLLKEAGIVALGQLAMFNAVSKSSIDERSKFRTVVDNIYTLAKDGNEAAILCLGQLSMILPEQTDVEDSDLQYVEKQLHKLHEIRQAEVHFTVGEALSYLACGWRSTALATKLDIQGSWPATAERKNTLGRLLDSTLKDTSTTKPSLKKASVMWLLCLIQFCGGEEEIQSRLGKCQAAFKRCLSDRDELVQESASRGLGLVYEKGDRTLKDDLVRDLVSSFSSDKQSQLAGNVSADTELFEPGALPTGDGSISTYKDIMSLAAEVGDSSLVYRFMSMASSNAIWSSRAAFGRFGLSNVLSDSSVDGYLASNPKLYPKLYRYRFDPNGGVQRSMNDIWNALVKDSSATIDKHFDAIMEDLLVNILGKEWRVRQASCAAIADLVQGRSFDKYEPYLERVWTQCFKVLDDIKESVRAAAASLARVLTGVLTRALESGDSSSKSAAVMLKNVLPFLLSPSGMESSAQDVQIFAVHTLLEIVKKGSGAILRPFIPELVERLISLLSSLEPESVNYIHLNASKYNLTEQKIDDMRLSSVRGSPLMEAVERCLDLLDDETMTKLSPCLERAMKSAVGLPSKVGSSRILVTLSTRRVVLFKSHADTFLKLIEKLVLDRNETVASSYAASAGYVARLASDKQILKLVDFAQKLYFQSGNDRESATPRRSITAGELMHALAQHASDRLNSLAASILPFVFVAKHDSNDSVKEPFQDTWNEAVGGSRAVLLYLKEILGLSASHLDSAQWILKHTASRSIADAIIAVSTLSKDISSDTAALLWPPLEKALGGKTWEGKESILPALVKFVEGSKRYYSENQEVGSMIVKIAIREAKRQNKVYRQHAIDALGQIAKARQDVDMNDKVFDIIEPLIAASDDGDAMDVDGGAGSKSEERREATVASGAETLLASVNPMVARGSTLDSQVLRVLNSLSAIPAMQAAAVQHAITGGMRDLFVRVRLAGEGESLSAAGAGVVKQLLLEQELQTETLRSKRAEAVASVAECSRLLRAELREEVQKLVQGERAVKIRERLMAALVDQ